jgi:hypothetical protein
MTCGLAWRCSLLLLSRDQCPDKGQVIITIFFSLHFCLLLNVCMPGFLSPQFGKAQHSLHCLPLYSLSVKE